MARIGDYGPNVARLNRPSRRRDTEARDRDTGVTDRDTGGRYSAVLLAVAETVILAAQTVILAADARIHGLPRAAATHRLQIVRDRSRMDSRRA